ncbi:MAG: PAS domain S-box protein [Croceibacterium sp.]
MIQVYDFYAALVESSDDAIVAKDINGVVISWNPAAERLFGYSNEEMCGRSIRCLLPNDRGDEEDLILKRIRGGERVAQYQTQRLHKDGHAVDISVTVSPVRDSAGTIVGASKIARNIGPMLDNQRRLRESEARLRMLADNIAQFAWIADASGKVVWFNKRWFDYTGLDPSQAADERRSSVLPEEYREPVRERYEQAVRDGKPWEDTFPLRRKDGELRWFLSRAQPIRDDDGGTVWWFGTNTDITEQREQA